jgi:hypothetical protein
LGGLFDEAILQLQNLLQPAITALDTLNTSTLRLLEAVDRIPLYPDKQTPVAVSVHQFGIQRVAWEDQEVAINNWPEKLPVSLDEPVSVEWEDQTVEVIGSVSVSNLPEVQHVHVDNEVEVHGDVGVTGRVAVTEVETAVKVVNDHTDSDPPVPIPLVITGAVVTSDGHGGPSHVIVDNTVHVDVENTPTVKVSSVESTVDVSVQNVPHVIVDGTVEANVQGSVLVTNPPDDPVQVNVRNDIQTFASIVDCDITLPVKVENAVKVDTSDAPVNVVPVLRNKKMDGTWVHTEVNASLPLPTYLVGPDNGIYKANATPVFGAGYYEINPNTDTPVAIAYGNSRIPDVYYNEASASTGRCVQATHFSA